ncbi:MAG TPA: ABC transporter ATP-binding protein [Spirochaetales bacterium]|nr:ABC transporter ATP-binding protein [Spirochaetales bacterium]HPM72885.1 ABC transporter ATP-binding protein [Spirochaetales bacterium]
MLKRFLPYYKPYLGLLALDLACALGLGLADLVFPAATRRVVDVIVPAGDMAGLARFGLLLVALYAVRAGLEFILGYYGHVLGVNIQHDLRRDIYRHLHTLDTRFFDDTKTGQIMSRIVGDLFDLAEISHHLPEDLIMAGVRLIGSLVVMLAIDWRLALVVFAIVPAQVLFSSTFRARFRRAFRRNKETMAVINEHIEESVSGVRVVRAFGNEDYERARFDDGNATFRSSRIESVFHIGVFNTGVSFLSNLGLVIVLVAGGYAAWRGSVSVGAYVAFALYVARFFQPIEVLVRSMEQFQEGAAGFGRFLEIVDTKPTIVDAPGAIELASVRGDVEFREVSFRYGDGLERVLERVDLRVAAGETVAIVGPSGAGKTTLCSLIPRFYDIEEGSITVDGLDVREATIASLRQAVGLVQQDVFLFSGSVRDNIAYGRLGASDEEVEAAAAAANALEFIRSLPLGLDTLVGERGVKLSGGQKQRISIARMFLKDPPILILDEATSSLDTMSELAIRESLDRLSRGRTTFIIAHRLATIRHAARILVLTEDGVVEQGRHDDLVAAGGVYKRLYDAQVESLLVS